MIKKLKTLSLSRRVANPDRHIFSQVPRHRCLTQTSQTVNFNSVFKFDTDTDLMYSNDLIGFDHSCYPTIVDIPQKSYSNRLSCVKTSLHQISPDILSIDDNLDCFSHRTDKRSQVSESEYSDNSFSLVPALPPRNSSFHSRVRSSTLPLNSNDRLSDFISCTSDSRDIFQPPLPPRRKGKFSPFHRLHAQSEMNVTNPNDRIQEEMIMQNIRDLVSYGWYWGPMTKEEAEIKLHSMNDGTFLVRDSSDDRHLLTISFRSLSKTFHTRIDFWGGKFSVFPNSSEDCYNSVGQLIEHAMNHCKNGVFFYSRHHEQPSLALPVCLTKPLSRFMQIRSLQHHCRFVIRQYTRFDLINSLGLPARIQEFVCLSIF